MELETSEICGGKGGRVWRADLVYSRGFMLLLGLTKLGSDIRNLFFTKQYNQECDFHWLPDYIDSLFGIEKGQNFSKYYSFTFFYYLTAAQNFL